MAKRGSSGISRLVAVNKPSGMSSHDVVNVCRRVFGERRVGHAGTLDPLASGVLLICVGPATRLDAYLVGHDKRYRMGVSFGIGTDTDDAEGAPIKTCDVPSKVRSESFARPFVEGLVGKGMQMPPVYSAIKVAARKSYDAARKGEVIALEPRAFEVYDAQLLSVDDAASDGCEWLVEMSVSKGTYMRSIARDMGRDLKTAAHVSSLVRVRSGAISLDECVDLDQLESNPSLATVDPLRALGVRYAFAREAAAKVDNGSPLPEGALSLNDPVGPDPFDPGCCTTSVIPSAEPARDGEIVAVLVDNRLKALYEYHESQHRYQARCVFAIGVERGTAV